MAATALGGHQVMAAEHRQVLGQMGGLEADLGLEPGDVHLGGGGEQLEDADADRMSEPLEEVGLDLVQGRSEEHTSELQSRGHLVCRLLIEKKKTPESHGQYGTNASL